MTQEVPNKPINVNEQDSVADDQRARLPWRRWLIGPFIGVYLLAYMMSYYTITEYTSKTWRGIKLSEANLTTNLTSAVGCILNESSSEVAILKEASSMASQYIVYYSLAQGVPAVVSNLILGSYTDAFGRKFILILGYSGTTIRIILSFLIVYFQMDLLFFIGACVLEGITGQYVTAFQVSLAYVSDVTKPGDQRTYGIAYILFNLSLFASLGGLFAGYLIQGYSYYAPFFVASVLLILVIGLTLVLLPESHPPEKRLTNKSITSVLYNSFSFFITKDINNNRWKYQLLLLAHAFCDFSFLGRVGVETLYQMVEPFCWSAEKIGVYGTVRSLGQAVFGILLVKFYKLVFSDISLAIIGTMAYAATFIIEGLADNSIMLYVAGVTCVFGVLESSTIRGVVSTMTSPQQQGAIFSAFAAVEVIVNLLSNVGTSAVYSLSVQYMRGFVFFVMTAVDSIAIILLVIVYIGLKLENKKVLIERL